MDEVDQNNWKDQDLHSEQKALAEKQAPNENASSSYCFDKKFERADELKNGASSTPEDFSLSTAGSINSETKLDIKPWFEEGLRFQCTGCGACCTGSPGYVYLSKFDLERLADHFSLTAEEFSQQYTQSLEGQYALLDRPGSFDCIFLKNKRCSVYESRPSQCRTFPWWIYHLRTPDEWEEAGKRCEGINHPEAPLVPSLHIQEQCLTYLDNLLEQNFHL